jgi:hypothetical protein
MRTFMTTVEDIERAVWRLARAEPDRFRAWSETFHADHFDERIERNARACKLDRMAGEVLAEHRAGRTRELGAT